VFQDRRPLPTADAADEEPGGQLAPVDEIAAGAFRDPDTVEKLAAVLRAR
jgi:hypothetical protein